MFDGEGAEPTDLQSADAAFEQAMDQAFSEAPPEAEPAPAPNAPPAAPTRGAPPRDEQGRFAGSPSRAPETSPEAAEPEAERPAEPSADEQPEAPPPAEEPAPEAQAAEYPTLSYRADGTDFSIEGSAVGEDGAFIPAAQLPEALRLMAAGRVHTGSFRRVLNEHVEGRRQAELRAQTAEKQLGETLSRISDLVKSGGIMEWAAEAAQNWPVLMAEAKAKAAEAELEHYRTGSAQRQEQEASAAAQPAMDDALRSWLTHYGADQQLTADDLARLYGRMSDPDFRARLFVRAPEDDPASGLRKGELAINHGLIAREVQFYAQAVIAERQAARRAAEAQRRNAAEKGGRRAPPAVSAKGTPAARIGKPSDFRNAQEADAALFDDPSGLDRLVQSLGG